MAAIGLSWDEAARYMVPGVVLARDNSPRNVTISGDDQPPEEVAATTKSAQFGIAVTVLELEKACHSNHSRRSLRPGYARLQHHGCSYRSCSLSVSLATSSSQEKMRMKFGDLNFGGKLWNIRPCSRGALLDVLQYHASIDPVFTEIGPQSVYADPWRQTLPR